MGNEGQQPPRPEQGSAEQQGYYSWQYDQEYPAEMPQQSPVRQHPSGRLFLPPPPSQPLPPYPQPPAQVSPAQPLPPYQQSPAQMSPYRQPPMQMSPAQPQPPYQQSPDQIPPAYGARPAQPQMRPQYQEPIQDMGTSLGYGQGMEYQYFDAPQPSQPMAQLRLERLQQLREERMRRQQRRMKSDITTAIKWGGRGANQPPPQAGPGWGAQAAPPMAGPVPPMQMSPAIPLPPREISPQRSGQLSPVLPQGGPAGAGLQPAGAGAQDTAMIQRVRIAKASLILTGAFIASRVLGMLRSSMFAFVFGTGVTSDAYLQAFLIPDMIFTIVAGGALSSAFIPVFNAYMLAEKDQRTAWHVASSALNLAVAVMTGLALIVIIFARQLVPLYNPGIRDPHELDLIASLTRIMLLQSIVLGGGVIVTAVLNAQQDFRWPAIGTVLYNVGLIGGLIPGIYLAFHNQRNDQIAVYAATWGVVLGAVLQVGIQLPGLIKVGMHYTPSFNWHHPGVIQIARQMVPRIVNAAMLFVSTFVDRGLIQLLGIWVLASHLADQNGVNGLITQYQYAFQLVLLPLGVFGMAVSTAAFPTLSENVEKGRLDRVRGTILETLRSILFMSIPSSVGLIVLGFTVIQVLFQHGRFSLSDAQATAVPLAFFAIGLAGLAAVEILTRSFYALRDSRTPVIVSIAQFIFKIALSLLLINVAIWGTYWGMGALALSTSIASLLEAAVLFWLLHQRVGDLQVRTVGLFIGRVLLASIAMGLGLLITSVVLNFVLGFVPALDTTRTPALGLGGTVVAFIKLLIELFIGVFIYLRGSRMLGIEELGPVRRVLDRLKLSWI